MRSIFVWNVCRFLSLECVSLLASFLTLDMFICGCVEGSPGLDWSHLWPVSVPLWFRIVPSTWVLRTLAMESRVWWLICLRSFPVFPSQRIDALKTWKVVLLRPWADPSFWTAMAFSSFTWCCYKASSSKFPTDHYWWMLLPPRHARHSILVIFEIMFFLYSSPIPF